jgi:hypothetical protein
MCRQQEEEGGGMKEKWNPQANANKAHCWTETITSQNTNKKIIQIICSMLMQTLPMTCSHMYYDNE